MWYGRAVRNALLRPACLVGLGYGIVVFALLATHKWDPLFFATLGPEWTRHDPAGVKRADGMIFYAIATDPLGRGVRFGDYRMERILYPMLARSLGLGRPALISWALVFINWAGIVLGTELADQLLRRAGGPSWMALGYGAWGGLGGALLKDTAEPVAYLFALLGIWWLLRARTWLASAAFLCALLGRETTALLVAPYLLFAGVRKGPPRWLPALVVAVLWLGWMLIVRLVLQAPVVPRPLPLPLRGLLSIRPLDLPLTMVVLVVPALVAAVLSTRELCMSSADARAWAVLLNALLVLALPPSTAAMFWHSGRLSTGLVVSTLLATSFDGLAPHVWRALAALYASSAVWTIAVVARYVFWDVVVLPGG